MIIEKDLDQVDEAESMDLLYPKNSHMDFNIGTALRSAASGWGKLLDTSFFESETFAQMKSAIEESVESKSNQEEVKSYDEDLITKTL